MLLMLKSDLIEILQTKMPQLTKDDIALSVNIILNKLTDTMAVGERIEIRGFGSFTVHYHDSKTGRNPKTGKTVSIPAKHVPHFKPGKELREVVAHSFQS